MIFDGSWYAETMAAGGVVQDPATAERAHTIFTIKSVQVLLEAYSTYSHGLPLFF